MSAKAGQSPFVARMDDYAHPEHPLATEPLGAVQTPLHYLNHPVSLILETVAEHLACSRVRIARLPVERPLHDSTRQWRGLRGEQQPRLAMPIQRRI